MKYTVTTKHLKLSEKTLAHIERHVKKINHMLPFLDPDAVTLDFVLRKNRKKRLNHIKIEIFEEDHQEKSIEQINPKAESPIYYDGTIKMILPKKPLVVHIAGENIDQAINIGFERLFKELETYKGRHLVDDSEYFNHDTIRKNSKFGE